MHSVVSGQGRGQPMPSITPPDPRARPRRAGRNHWAARPRGRRPPREPGRGQDDQERPALIAWRSRQGGGVIHATRACTVKTGQQAADLARQVGSTLATDSASSDRWSTGYEHDAVNHTKK